MVGNGAITAKTYHDNAVKLRDVARDTSDPNKAYLRFIADKFDRLAKTIESATTRAG